MNGVDFEKTQRHFDFCFSLILMCEQADLISSLILPIPDLAY